MGERQVLSISLPTSEFGFKARNYVQGKSLPQRAGMREFHASRGKLTQSRLLGSLKIVVFEGKRSWHSGC
jgi:hypothetical protein